MALMWWVKYRHKFSSGCQNNWEWTLVGNGKSKKAVEKFVKDELCPTWAEKYDYSEHYRGIDFEVTEAPPPDVIEQSLKEAKEKVAHWTDMVQTYEKMLEFAPKEVAAEPIKKGRK